VRVAALREHGSEHAQDAASDSYVRDVTHQRHPGFHKTASIDYAIVLSGEIHALLDEGEGWRCSDPAQHESRMEQPDQPAVSCRLRADRLGAHLIGEKKRSKRFIQKPAPTSGADFPFRAGWSVNVIRS
jgi:hypothetical protein